MLAGIGLAGSTETPCLVVFSTEAAHHAVALDGFRSDVREVAHGGLDLLALLAEFAAGVTDHDADDRQDYDHDQGQLPVHPDQIAEQEDDGQPFADDYLDGVGRCAGHHRHVVSDAGNQVARIIQVEVGVRQAQQILEKRQSQVMDQPKGNPRQVIVAEVRTDALPEDDHDQQQRNPVGQIEVADHRNVMECRGVWIGESVDEEFQHAGLHRLGRGKDHESQKTNGKCAYERAQVAEEPEVDLQRGIGLGIHRDVCCKWPAEQNAECSMRVDFGLKRAAVR